MAPECWSCGEPIRRNEPAECLPYGRVAVHAKCVRREAEDLDRSQNDVVRKAA